MDGANTIGAFQCGHDIVTVIESRWIEPGRSPVLHDDRKGWPAI